MIIEVRGGGGSGKSTVVRKIMARCRVVKPIYLQHPMRVRLPSGEDLIWDGSKVCKIERGSDAFSTLVKRKKPMAYYCQDSNLARELAVLGHYETDCGGCDTIHSPDAVYNLVHVEHLAGRHVLFEGKMIGMGAAWRSLRIKDDLLIVLLDVSLEECVASMNERRLAKGKPPIEPGTKSWSNAEGAHRASHRAAGKLRDQGVRVVKCSRVEAVRLIAELLGLEGNDEIEDPVERQIAQMELF